MRQVLIIEDSAADLQLFHEALEEASFPTATKSASNAPQAFDCIRRIERGEIGMPDFIVLDLNLPAINGDIVLREIRASVALKHVPVIVWTSGSNLFDLNTCKVLGATEIHIKPRYWDDYRSLVLSFNRRYSLHIEIAESDLYQIDDSQP